MKNSTKMNKGHVHRLRLTMEEFQIEQMCRCPIEFELNVRPPNITVTEAYFLLMYPFGFSFQCFVDSLVFFTSSGTSSHWYFRLYAMYLYLKSDSCVLQVSSILHTERFLMILLCFGAILMASFFS